jgi:hypothetical protein
MRKELEREKVGDDALVTLDEETLTDDSKVYNICILGDGGQAKVELAMADRTSAMHMFCRLTDVADTIGIEFDVIR